MKRKVIVVSMIILLVVMLLIGINGKEENKTFMQDGVMYALVVNGKPASSFPEKGLYRVDTECTNATCKWDYDSWKLNIENITGNVSCNITFTAISKTYLNQYVIDQVTETSSQTDWKVVNENGYRYEGKNPNNYVWFNNELWRIIGVFDETTHGVSGTNLVKIIRVNSIGGLAWNKSRIGSWTNASLYKLLNPIEGDTNSGAYYNGTNGTNSGYCYISSSVTGNCDYSEIGIQEAYRRMIQKVTWKFVGHSTNAATAEIFYTAERSGTNSVENYIGLMYVSDYGYATLETSCARTTNLSAYSSATCAGQNWLAGQGYEWTLVRKSGQTFYGFILYYDGSVSTDESSPDRGDVARPVLYLDSNTYLISGDGTVSNPYMIGM